MSVNPLYAQQSIADKSLEEEVVNEQPDLASNSDQLDIVEEDGTQTAA